MRISFIGAGNIGTCLAVLLKRAGYEIAGVSSRRMKSCEDFMAHVKAGRICESNQEAAKLGDIIFITTNDDSIAQVAEEIKDEVKGKLVIHCSGALTTDALDSAESKKAAMHPMQAVPCVDKGLKSLPGSCFDVQCNNEVYPEVEKLIHSIGGVPVRISRENKIFNHIASCMISNYSVALFNIALEIYKGTEIEQEQAVKMMLPLFEENIRNVENAGAVKALTGPIERGDVETVRKHLKALEGKGWIRALYMCLGRSTLKIAEKKGLEAEKAREIKELFG